MSKKAPGRLASRKGKSQPGGLASPWRLAAATTVAALSFLFIVGQPAMGFFSSTVLIRGALAGIAAGLLFVREEWLYAAAVAAAGALVSTLLLLVADAASSAAAIMFAAVLVAGLLAAGIAYLVPHAPQWPRMLVVALALTLAVGWSLGVLGGPLKPALDQTRSQVSQVPQPERYGFDALIYIKAVDYMRTGLPYYDAFQKAWTEDSRLSGKIPSALSFREPLLFEFWKLLPGSPAGVSILDGYLLLSWAGVILCWLVSRRFVADGVAMMTGLLMLPIYVYAAFGGLWFTMAEIWAAVLVVGALCLLVRRQYLASAIVIVLAVAVRELAAIYVPAWVIAWWFAGERKRWIPGLVVALAGPLAALGIHLASAPAAGSASPGALKAWMHSTGLPRTLTAIRFGGLSPFSDSLIPTAAVASIVGPFLVKEAWLRWTLLFIAVVPLVFLTVFSASQWDYYWGLTFQPTLVALSALVFVRVFPSQVERSG